MMEEPKIKGLSGDQTHRLLEDIENLALSHKLHGQLLENIGRTIRGMMNGNDKKGDENVKED